MQSIETKSSTINVLSDMQSLPDLRGKFLVFAVFVSQFSLEACLLFVHLIQHRLEEVQALALRALRVGLEARPATLRLY
jgi:hypothetical protein